MLLVEFCIYTDLENSNTVAFKPISHRFSFLLLIGFETILIFKL